MATKKTAPEFYFDEKRGLYRKRIKNPATGKWQDVYGHTKQETRENVRAAEAAWAEAAQARENPLVYQYAKTWYDLNTVNLTEKGKEGIRNAINNHICPVIGGMMVCDVTHDDALRVMAAASALGNQSQKRILNVMRRIFTAALQNDLIKKDPCIGVKASGAVTVEKAPLSKTQQAALIDAVRETRAWPFVMLGLYAGLRREESLGLCWDCVHLDAEPPYISVRRSCIWEKGKPKVSEALKSAAARRDIPIPPQLVACLRSLSHSASGHVISDTAGQPVSQASFRALWGAVESRTVHAVTETVNGVKSERMLTVGEKVRNKDLRISLDFKCTPHQLRHTYITELILAGANVKTVQYLAGHSNVQMTLDIYAHLVDNQPSFTSAAVMAAFSGQKQQGAKQGGCNIEKMPSGIEYYTFS